MPRTAPPPFPILLAALSVASVPAAAAPPKKATPVTAAPRPATAPAGGPRLTDAYREAVKAARAGDLPKAEALCRTVLELDPKAAPVWGLLGQVRLAQNKPEDARTAFTKATMLAPKEAAFWSGRAGAEFQSGRYAEAEASAKKALARAPKDDGALATLASAQMATKQYKAAIPNLRRLAELRGGMDRVLGQNLGYALEKTGDGAGALAVAKRVAEGAPKDVAAQVYLAEVAERHRDPASAYAALKRARALSPDEPRLAVLAARAAAAAGKPSEGAAILEKLAAARPQDAEAQFQLGLLRYSDESVTGPERFARAEKPLAAAAALDPKNAAYLGQLGLARMFQGPARSEAAAEAFRSALALDAKQATAHMGLGYLAEQRKDWQESAREYRAALEAAPGNDFVRRRLAGVLLSAGSRAEAYTEFWELASRNPRNVVYLKELASFLMVDRDWPTARAAYQQVLQRVPKDVDGLLGLGQTFEKERRYDEARRQFEAAVAIAPKRPLPYYLLGVLYEEQRQPDKAVAAYEKLIEVDPENAAGRWQLAQVYAELNQDEKALAQMRRVTLRAGDPNRLAYRLGPANLYARRKRYPEAIAEIEKVLAENPQEAGLKYALADVQLQAGRAADAEKVALELGEKAKADERARARTLLARVYEETGRLDEAAAGYEEVLAQRVGDPEARAGLVRVRGKQGKPDAAAGYLESLATAAPEGPNPDAVAALEALWTQGEKKEPAKFVAFHARLAEKYPKSREVAVAAAEARLRWSNPGGRPADADREAALALYKRVLEAAPNDADAHFAAASQLEALKRKEEAVAAYREALRLDPKRSAARSALKRLGATETATAPDAGSKPSDGEKQGGDRSPD